MPHQGNPFEKGDLYVKFEVEFPEGPLEEETKKSLSSILPPSNADPIPEEDDDVEEALMKDGQLHEFGKGSGETTSSFYEEDEEDSQGQGVQCAQQ